MTVRLATGVIVAAALAVLTACGTQASSGPQVASVSGVGNSAAASTSAAAPETGIQERLDDTSQRQNELLEAYMNCLHDHGAVGTWIPPIQAWKVNYEDPTKVTPAELQACASKRPIPPPELDPTKNPHYAQDVQADAQCARDHGISITIGPDGWWLPTDPNQPNLNTITHQCLIQAFGNN